MPNPFRRRRRPAPAASSTALSPPAVRRGFTATRLPKDFLEMTDRQQKKFIRELLSGISPGPVAGAPATVRNPSSPLQAEQTRQRRRNH